MAFTIKHISFLTGMALVITALNACTPESSSQDLGPLPVASFTAIPLSGNPNKFVVQNTTKGAFISRWVYGDGVDNSASSLVTDTFTFAKHGDYAIQLTTYTKGGSATAVQQVSVTNDLPPVDILKGGDMGDDASSYWTVLNTGGDQTTIAIAGGVLKFSNTGNTNGAIYQAVNVIAGRDYTFHAHVSGGGATNTWFETYFLTTKPVQGSDFSGTNFVALNTWAGCGNATFDGELTEIGCDGASKAAHGKMKFATSGTIYIAFKGGSSGGNMGPNGITIDNVAFLQGQ